MIQSLFWAVLSPVLTEMVSHQKDRALFSPTPLGRCSWWSISAIQVQIKPVSREPCKLPMLP